MRYSIKNLYCKSFLLQLHDVIFLMKSVLYKDQNYYYYKIRVYLLDFKTKLDI